MTSYRRIFFAPVFWSDIGSIFVVRPTWTINTSNDDVEEYINTFAALDRLDGQCPYSVVRKFSDADSTREFIAKENAYPRRLHYRVVERGLIEVYVRDLPGPPIRYPALGQRDNGWDLVDGDGWYRHRYAKPTLLRDVHIPSDDGFVGGTEHLSGKRHSLFFP